MDSSVDLDWIEAVLGARDAFAVSGGVCNAQSPDAPVRCSRLPDHLGAHIAVQPDGRRLATWQDEH
jgi:hypothetical protein